MEYELLPIGTHCLITIRNCDAELLKYKHVVENLLNVIAKECELNVVAVSSHQFSPIGVTSVYVLAESHMSIHTYPENNAAYMDIFCCSKTFSPAKAHTVISRVFKDSIVDIQTVIR